MGLYMGNYQVGSLFAGVGGVCEAFKQSSCDVVWANEFDARACKTYRLNHKTTQLIEDDIQNLSNYELKKILRCFRI